LVDVAITDGERDVLLFASNGKAVRFAETAVRAVGRTARGVRGMTLAEGERVVTMMVADVGDILTATERGFGKRTPLADYPRKGRGTQGVIAIQTSARNGNLVGAVQVTEDFEVMLISNQGTLVRTRVAEIAQVGRNTQGVTLIRLPAEESLVSLAKVAALPEDLAADDGDATDHDEASAAPTGPTGDQP
jgi:DNA gyrase subunit A